MINVKIDGDGKFSLRILDGSVKCTEGELEDGRVWYIKDMATKLLICIATTDHLATMAFEDNNGNG